MSYVLRRPRPKLADVSCRKIKFDPGDRVIVRVYRKIDKDEERKIRKGIQKWAGCEVEVLIYNALKMEVDIEKPIRTGL